MDRSSSGGVWVLCLSVVDTSLELGPAEVY